jgi:homoserine dehydrogenase
MQKRTIGITLLGNGVVASGVARILTEQAELLIRRTGLSFDVRHVVVRDPAKYSGSKLPLTADANAAIDDPQSQIIIELIGGTTIAGTLIERALKLGKPVVTANKSLLAERGADLFALARKHGACIAFEATCGGGIPIIEALTRGLLANRIDALVGIVNGTCNFILTQMTRHGQSYEDALKDAQRAGFAEADPSLDVSGRDAAQKLSILAGLAFNARVTERDIHIEGVDKVNTADLQFARELGYVIKLLAIAERKSSEVRGQRSEASSEFRVQSSERAPASAASSSLNSDLCPLPSPICLRVHPTLVHEDDVLADVSGSFNAISVYGNALGHALFYGRGAGQMPTASAVVSDQLGVALGTVPLGFKQLRIFPDSTSPAEILPFDQLQTRYYLRIMVKDQPGVIGQISTVLGSRGISISAIRQQETNDGQTVPLIITTHLANEGAMRQALGELNALSTILPPAICLRIIDPPKEFAAA